jgi:hypothetical protein
MQIQLANKINNYSTSIQVNLAVQIALLVFMYIKYLRFSAMLNVCETIKEYYKLIDSVAIC